MRNMILGMIAMAGLLALPAMAQPPEKGGDKGDRPRGGEFRERMLKEHDKDGDGKLSEEERKAAHEDMHQKMHERMLKEFDKDGDGKLSDEERQKARESMRERFGRGGKDGRPRAEGKPDRKGDRAKGGKKPGRDGDRGPDGFRGPHGPGGPMGGRPIPPPEELFKKFDADSNDSLSRDEFMKLAEFVKEHHPRRPMGPHGQPRFEGRRPDGPRGDRRPPRDGGARRGERERSQSPEKNAEESI